jgi:hypothetical protein
MGYGIIGYSVASSPNQPSGSVWGDQSAFEVSDEGTGYYSYLDFKATLPTVATGNVVLTNSGTLAYNSSFDSVATLTSGSTADNDASLYTRPLGPITLNSGKKVWFEANIGLQNITTAKGVFIGLANLASLGAGLLIAAASATKNSNTIGTASGDQSFVGFWMHGDALTDFDIVWANTITTALTPSTIVAPGTSATGGGVVVAGVLASSQTSNTPNPANLNYAAGATIPAAMIVDTTSPSQANLVAGTQGFVKFGIRFDGNQYIYFYVNGLQVAKLQVTSSFDAVSSFAGIVQVVAGTNAVEKLDVSWLRAAAKVA